MVVTFLFAFLSISWITIKPVCSKCDSTSYKYLLSNDRTFLFATQTENTWFSFKHEE